MGNTQYSGLQAKEHDQAVGTVIQSHVFLFYLELSLCKMCFQLETSGAADFIALMMRL